MKDGIYTHKLSFRVDDKTYRFIKKQIKIYGISESTYIRKILEQQQGADIHLESKEAFLAKKDLTRELNRIGTNINQIVRNVNANYYIDYEKKKLFALMNEIKEKVDRLL